MRDILITLFIAGLLPLIIWRPAFGALAWAWISIMNPHKLAYGFAFSLPFAQIIAAVTIVGFVFSKHRKALPTQGGVILLVILMGWMTLTSSVSLNDPSIVWDRWLFVVKIHVMLLITLMLLRGRQDIDRLIWVMVVSLGFYGVKGGIFTFATGGGGRVWGPPGGMLAGNNEFAVGLIMIVPLMYYLRQTSSNTWVRHGLLASTVLVAFAILGTQSRGALLGMLAMAAVLGVKSKYPIRSILGLGTLLLVAVAFMPDSWTQRMDTIQEFRDDTSAMSRIWTWKTLLNVAIDRPLFGAGFGADSYALFERYAPTDAEYAVFQGKAFVAHSIYLQALGEHGFPGLLVYICLGFWIWWAAGRTAALAKGDQELSQWVPLLMGMCQVSILGFAVGGAFLSLMHLDVPYYFMALVVLTRVAVRSKLPDEHLPARSPGHVARIEVDRDGLVRHRDRQGIQ